MEYEKLAILTSTQTIFHGRLFSNILRILDAIHDLYTRYLQTLENAPIIDSSLSTTPDCSSPSSQQPNFTISIFVRMK